MSPEIDRFHKWLRCRNPHATTHIHYTSDVKLFFTWVTKPPTAITLHDVDRYVAHCRGLGHAPATVNHRLAALRAFYRLLAAQPRPAQAPRHPPERTRPLFSAATAIAYRSAASRPAWP